MTKLFATQFFLLLLCGTAWSQTPTVSIEPEVQTVGVGQELRIDVHVRDFSTIRTYGIRVSYDITLLECIGVEQTGYFSGYNTFFFKKIDSVRGEAGADESILGPGFVRGEGNVFTLRFRALARGGAAMTFSTTTVYDSVASNIHPIDLVPGAVTIDVQNGVDAIPAGAALALTAPWPNPALPGQNIHCSMSGVSTLTGAVVYDRLGRKVCDLSLMVAAGGLQEIRWDGSDAAGKAVRPGVYYFTVHTLDAQAVRAVIIQSR